MAEDCRMNIDQLRFRYQYALINQSKKITFRNAVGAEWTLEVFFYRPFGLRIKLPLQLRFRRAWMKLKCEKLARRVFVEGKIMMKSRGSFETSTEVKNFFAKGDNSFQSETIFENVFEEITALYISGGLNIYVNPENYFYYRYGLGFVPVESQVQATRLQNINKLSNDILDILSLEYTYDVVLRCESESIKAHKVVLSARSKVFSAMFQHPLEERKTNVVDIQNMSPITLKAVLEYIYSGKVTMINYENAFELVIAADRYFLPGLKKLILYYLQSIMSLDNAVDILTFAQVYDENLKKKALDYICMEYEHIKKTEEWCSLQTEQPQLANEVLSNIIDFVNSDKNYI